MDIQKVASTGTAVAVIGGGSLFGGNYAIDQATGGPEKRVKAKQSELQLIVREVVRSAPVVNDREVVSLIPAYELPLGSSNAVASIFK